MSLSLFNRFFRSFQKLKDEFKDHPLEDIINYFQNSFEMDDLQNKIYNSLFDKLFSDWISKGSELNQKLKLKKSVSAKILVTKYSLKALRKFNSIVTENNLELLLPIIVLDSSKKDKILKQFAETCISYLDLSKVETEMDLINEFKQKIKLFLFGEEYNEVLNNIEEFLPVNDLKKLFSEENLEKFISSFAKILNGSNSYPKRRKDSNDTGKNDPKRPKK